MNFEQLTGRVETHLENFHWRGREYLAFPEASEALLKFLREAKEAGFDPHIVSSFRSFEQQKTIWEKKFSGERVLLDDHGHPLNFDQLSEEEIILAILRWSAIPGASRHHWGTDFDIVDFSGGEVKFDLIASEFDAEGPFAHFGYWVSEQLKKGTSHGFYRPYREDLGGVGIEPWHFSYAPISLDLEEEYTLEIFEQNLAAANLSGKDYLISEARNLYRQFVENISRPAWFA